MKKSVILVTLVVLLASMPVYAQRPTPTNEAQPAQPVSPLAAVGIADAGIERGEGMARMTIFVLLAIAALIGVLIVVLGG